MDWTYTSRDLRNYKPIAMCGICLDPELRSTIKKFLRLLRQSENMNTGYLIILRNY